MSSTIVAQLKTKPVISMNSSKFTVFALLVGCFIGVSQALEYGQPCNVTSKPELDECRSVNLKDPLKCTPTADNSTAFCACEPEMFRHEELNYCVSSQGGKCTLQSGDGQPSHQCTKFAQCFNSTEKAIERKEGKCYCDPDAIHDELTGHCKLTFGSKRCTVATECLVGGLLTCREGNCGCEDEEHQVWNSTANSCQTLINGSCAANKPFPKPECYGLNTVCKNITASEFVCECSDGYTEAPDKSCYKDFEGTCEDKNDCHPQFECKGNATKQCLCPDGQLYHVGSKTCRLLVGQQCEVESDLECTVHASCTNNTCTCTTGFISSSGTCLAKYGSECSEVGCYEPDFLQCVDTTKTCGCVDKYLPESNKCVGLIGESCRSTDEDCIGNSKCLNDRCGCPSGQEQQDDLKQCVALYGQNCDDSTIHCKNGQFLSCINSTCNCNIPSTQVYDESRTSCVGKADFPCLGELNLCVANSSCSPFDNTQNICKCNANFANKEGQCLQSNGSPNVVNSSSIILSILLMIVKFV
ncbi:Tenascin-X [Orchesella cincta]|uniref:Tenascin-X n=1 Tax=Orchesella cincta TaxID=48709 RepID=A0A1D2N729_ORCCI|nr:Tenascin-X [Orchesella cincta]